MVSLRVAASAVVLLGGVGAFVGPMAVSADNHLPCSVMVNRAIEDFNEGNSRGALEDLHQNTAAFEDIREGQPGFAAEDLKSAGECF
jgi:hypothetical protein